MIDVSGPRIAWEQWKVRVFGRKLKHKIKGLARGERNEVGSKCIRSKEFVVKMRGNQHRGQEKGTGKRYGTVGGDTGNTG